MFKIIRRLKARIYTLQGNGWMLQTTAHDLLSIVIALALIAASQGIS